MERMPRASAVVGVSLCGVQRAWQFVVQGLSVRRYLFWLIGLGYVHVFAYCVCPFSQSYLTLIMWMLGYA